MNNIVQYRKLRKENLNELSASMGADNAIYVKLVQQVGQPDKSLKENIVPGITVESIQNARKQLKTQSDNGIVENGMMKQQGLVQIRQQKENLQKQIDDLIALEARIIRDVEIEDKDLAALEGDVARVAEEFRVKYESDLDATVDAVAKKVKAETK
jgi:hypothetical protein